MEACYFLLNVVYNQIASIVGLPRWELAIFF